MEPLIKHWESIRLRVYWEVAASTPDSQVWGSVYRHLWNRFDGYAISQDIT